MRLAVGVLVIAATLAPDVGAEPSAVRVTTDSQEYCTGLAQRFATLPRAEEEPARTLAADGQRLCSSGHVRTGVAKLRRALRAAMTGPSTQTSQVMQSPDSGR